MYIAIVKINLKWYKNIAQGKKIKYPGTVNLANQGLFAGNRTPLPSFPVCQ